MARSVIWKNLGYTFLWQGTNYLVPLATIPYLARVLGPTGFGIVGFVNAFALYLTQLTDWGFTLSATHEVAQVRDDPAALNEVFWNTLLAKLLLGTLSLAVLVVAALSIPSLRPYAVLLLIGWLQVVGSIITADWFLQGLELMPRFALAGMTGKVVAAAVIFGFVRHGDLGVAIAAQGIGMISTGAFCLYLGLNIGVGRPRALSIGRAWRRIKDGWEVFASGASFSLYSDMNVVALALFSTPLQAGMFMGADKLRNAVQRMIHPVSTVMYPRLSSMAAHRDPGFLPMVRRLFLLQGLGMALLAAALWFGAPAIVHLVLGKGYDAAIPVLRLIAPVPCLAAFSNVLGVELMLPLGLRSEFLVCMAVPAFLSLIYTPLLAHFHGATGVGLGLLVTDSLVLLLSLGMTWYRRDAIADNIQHPRQTVPTDLVH